MISLAEADIKIANQIDADTVVKHLGEVVVLLDGVLTDVSVVVKTDGYLVSNSVKLAIDVVPKIVFDVLAVGLFIHVFYHVPDRCLLF